MYMEDKKYGEEVFTSKNILLVYELDGSENYIERIFINATTFYLINSNAGFENFVTTPGKASLYGAVYIVQNRAFYEMIMFRRTIPLPVTNFELYSRMYSMSLTFGAMGVSAVPCFHQKCMDFYQKTMKPHKHNRKGEEFREKTRITENLELVIKVPDTVEGAEFRRKFFIVNREIHGSNSPTVLCGYSEFLKRCYDAERKPTQTDYVRVGNTFTTISTIKSEYRVTPDNKITSKTESSPNAYPVVEKQDVIDYYKRAAQEYRHFFITSAA